MSMKGWLARIAAGSGLAVAALTAQAYTETSGGYNMPVGVTEISREVHGLHMLVFWVCVAIAVVVFGVMTYSIIMHRRSKHPKPADFHESTLVEIIWTTLPFVILISLAVPAAGTLIRMEDTRNADMTIKVTGYQWKWQYEYLGEDVSFFSTLAPASNQARQLGSGVDVNTVDNYLVDVDHPVVIPVGKKVRFLLTSNDVIHAWWVPELAVKKDAIPGYINEVWTKVEQPGTYRGVCAELCGRDHGFMPIVVKVLPEAEYQAWLAQQKGGEVVAAAEPVAATDAVVDAPAAAPVVAPAAAVEVAAAEPAVAAPAELSKDALIKQGEGVFKANCMACHQANGQGLPPNFPTLVGSAVVGGPAAAQIAQVINGKNLMPPFKQLSDADIAAVITYTRNSWGNDSGMVQPSDVATAR
ncbi:cytochrome c oxidase subunit II [Sinimarinibacterium sp. CAU 1509]|uniref:cytochrome c oxidase subunit II n=1 Tax=Sinimarinibacterium sp. CAU 1509 TaxID=2562283 RepID=UPI0010AB8196|nr:cytochrome c oxidase subunit II [Sinimarinibacterium sp. CAU 1509]TJY59063.1 cytochrome c oxidase subunit II [Sinimarinibacterium sp. CAU 1509]